MHFFISKVVDEESETLNSMCAKLCVSISETEEVYTLLQALRKKLHNNSDAAVEAVKSGLLKYVNKSIREIPPDDKVSTNCCDSCERSILFYLFYIFYSILLFGSLVSSEYKLLWM